MRRFDGSGQLCGRSRVRGIDPPDFAFSEGGLLVRRAHHPELVEGHVRRTEAAHNFTVVSTLGAERTISADGPAAMIAGGEVRVHVPWIFYI